MDERTRNDPGFSRFMRVSLDSADSKNNGGDNLPLAPRRCARKLLIGNAISRLAYRPPGGAHQCPANLCDIGKWRHSTPVGAVVVSASNRVVLGHRGTPEPMTSAVNFAFGS